MHIQIYAYMHVHMHIHVYIHIRIHMLQMHIRIHIHIHIHIHAHTQAHTHTYDIGTYTCEQQKGWGKCDVSANPWMVLTAIITSNTTSTVLPSLSTPPFPWPSPSLWPPPSSIPGGLLLQNLLRLLARVRQTVAQPRVTFTYINTWTYISHITYACADTCT